MIYNILREFVARASKKDSNANDLTKCLYEVMLHESMIKNKGNFTNACQEIGISRTAGSKYLGITQKEWVDKYSDLYELNVDVDSDQLIISEIDGLLSVNGNSIPCSGRSNFDIKITGNFIGSINAINSKISIDGNVTGMVSSNNGNIYTHSVIGDCISKTADVVIIYGGE